MIVHPGAVRERMQAWLARLEALCPRAIAADPDPEVFHASRVSSRRLRTAIALLRTAGAQADPTAWQELDRGLGRLARSLGPIRDADVLAAHLAELGRPGSQRHDDPAARSAFGLLRGGLESRRDEALERLPDVPELHPPFHERVRAFVETFELSGDAAAAAAVTVEKWTREFAAAAGHAIEAERPEQWHALRLVGKRLRYAIELVHGKGQAGSPHERLVQVQQTLGQAHDHRVWERACLDLRRSLTRRGADVLARAGLADLARRESCEARRQETRFRDDWLGNLATVLAATLGVIPDISPGGGVIGP